MQCTYEKGAPILNILNTHSYFIFHIFSLFFAARIKPSNLQHHNAVNIIFIIAIYIPIFIIVFVGDDGGFVIAVARA